MAPHPSSSYTVAAAWASWQAQPLVRRAIPDRRTHRRGGVPLVAASRSQDSRRIPRRGVEAVPRSSTVYTASSASASPGTSPAPTGSSLACTAASRGLACAHQVGRSSANGCNMGTARVFPCRIPTFQLEDKLFAEGGSDVMFGRVYRRRSG